MKKFRVWCPEQGLGFDLSRPVNAKSAAEAAETAVRWIDEAKLNYKIAETETDITVQVHDCETGRCVTMIVQGEAAPTYRARLKIEPVPAQMIGIENPTGTGRSIDVHSTITEAGDIEIETNVLGDVQRRVLRMEDEAVRAALIKLGWSPPTAGRNQLDWANAHGRALSFALARCLSALEKACHDRDRYRARIELLQGQHSGTAMARAGTPDG